MKQLFYANFQESRLHGLIRSTKVAKPDANVNFRVKMCSHKCCCCPTGVRNYKSSSHLWGPHQSIQDSHFPLLPQQPSLCLRLIGPACGGTTEWSNGKDNVRAALQSAGEQASVSAAADGDSLHHLNSDYRLTRRTSWQMSSQNTTHLHTVGMLV